MSLSTNLKLFPTFRDTPLGNSSFNDAKNKSILNYTVRYIFDTKRFDVPLTNL